ncbi:MAG: hypothetical protein IPN76_07425 [Saprospiraceae bacterium]|nr:hypothetical protein [Saprospiraceae bacterium]
MHHAIAQKFTLAIVTVAFFFFLPRLALAQPNNGYIQDVVMPTPNAAALAKFTEVPVSYYSGVPSTNIPIYTVTDGPLALPISLDYHSSGVKVGEMASWVGQGWSLSAGGMINRTVIATADETVDKGYFHNGRNLTGSNAELNNIIDCPPNTQCLDTEPDIFHFSVPGYSGKFYFDKDSIVQLVPKEDVLIKRQGTFDMFTMIVPDGTKYFFGKNPSTNAIAIERTQTPAEGSNGTPSTWYLTRVESNDGVNFIDLTYTDENYSYTELASCSYDLVQCVTNNGFHWSEGESCSTTLQLSMMCLRTINIKGKKTEPDYFADRYHHLHGKQGAGRFKQQRLVHIG